MKPLIFYFDYYRCIEGYKQHQRSGFQRWRRARRPRVNELAAWPFDSLLKPNEVRDWLPHTHSLCTWCGIFLLYDTLTEYLQVRIKLWLYQINRNWQWSKTTNLTQCKEIFWCTYLSYNRTGFSTDIMSRVYSPRSVSFVQTKDRHSNKILWLFLNEYTRIKHI